MNADAPLVAALDAATLVRGRLWRCPICGGHGARLRPVVWGEPVYVCLVCGEAIPDSDPRQWVEEEVHL